MTYASPCAALFCLMAVALPRTGAEVIRIGDAGSRPDPSRYDERLPEMGEWALAGVEGGIPYIQRVVAELPAGGDLTTAVAAASVSVDNPGVIRLAAGEYSIPGRLKLKPGLVLRGISREQTHLLSELDEMVSPYGVGEAHAIELASHSALEDLTVSNRHVLAKDPSSYAGKYDNPGAPCSGLVRVGGKCSNAWIQRCALTHAGSNPLSISGKHFTLRDSLVDHAYNKGGKGHGYLEVGHASHLLFYNCEIKNIRHISIMWKSRFVVILHCRLNIDINYHDGLPTQCLVESTTIDRRGGHHWSPICFGWEPWQDVGPGPRCFLWNNTFDGDGGGADQIKVLRDTTPGYAAMETKKPMILDFGPPPAHGTLYAVTGKHLPYEVVAQARCLDQLAKARASDEVQQILFYAQSAQRLFAADSDEHAQAQQAIDAVEAKANAALEDLGSRADGDDFHQFNAHWAGTAAIERAAAQAAEAAAVEWAKVTKGDRDPLASKVSRFVEEWHGLAPLDEAMRWYNQYAGEKFARIEEDLDSVSQTMKFIDKWPHAEVTERVRQAYRANLQRELDDLIKQKDGFSSRQRKRAAALFEGTPLEQQAREALSAEPDS